MLRENCSYTDCVWHKDGCFNPFPNCCYMIKKSIPTDEPDGIKEEIREKVKDSAAWLADVLPAMSVNMNEIRKRRLICQLEELAGINKHLNSQITEDEPERVEGETKQDRVRRLAGRIAKDLGNCLFCDYGTNWSWDKLCSVLEDMKTLANAKGQPIKFPADEPTTYDPNPDPKGFTTTELLRLKERLEASTKCQSCGREIKQFMLTENGLKPYCPNCWKVPADEPREHKMSAQEIKEVADLILKDDTTRRATKRHNLLLIGELADILLRSENET